MRQREAEQLLGGYATGTLTEVERRTLFAAAMGHQAVFDALMDEEALRELLADPSARAQLLAALSAAAAPRIVPFWRRSGLLGAAASLLVASLAGLVYLRGPEKVPPPVPQAMVQAPAVAPAEAASAKPVPAEKKKGDVAPRQAAAAPPPAIRQLPAAPAAGTAAPGVEDAARVKAAEVTRAEAMDNLARKAEAPRPAAAHLEMAASAAPVPVAKQARVAGDTAQATAPGVAAGLLGGAVGGVAPEQAYRADAGKAGAKAPSWTLDSGPDGTTRIQVEGPAALHPVLLRRGTGGVEVLVLKVTDPGGDRTRWAAVTRLAADDVLDLYLLNAPAAEPARLPERGPVEGDRVRIHPTSKK